MKNIILLLSVLLLLSTVNSCNKNETNLGQQKNGMVETVISSRSLTLTQEEILLIADSIQNDQNYLRFVDLMTDSSIVFRSLENNYNSIYDWENLKAYLSNKQFSDSITLVELQNFIPQNFANILFDQVIEIQQLIADLYYSYVEGLSNDDIYAIFTVIENTIDDPDIGSIPCSQACKAVYNLCMKQAKRDVGVTWGKATMEGVGLAFLFGPETILVGFVWGGIDGGIDYSVASDKCQEDYDLCCKLCPQGKC
ncbi:MAG TPA: hypothetical protein DCQ58_04020 [Saprospirales bacterium]|nr:hypothetical protein [Saprospirales bacterium]